VYYRKTTTFVLFLFCLLVSPLSLYAVDITVGLPYEGINRSYLLHVPSSYNASTPMPVVLVLHGGGGSPTGIRWTTQMNTVADAEGFIVAYPAGTNYYPYKIPGLGLVWNDGMVLPKLLKANDVGFIGAVLDKIEATYNINQQRVYAAGYSNGAFMACDLVKELPNRIAAIGLVGGITGADQIYPAPDRAVPLIDFQGVLDPYVPYNGGTGGTGLLKLDCQSVLTAMSSWVAHNGDLPDPIATQVINQAVMTEWGGGGADVVLWTLEDGGHTWPGGKSNIPSNGPVNNDIFASQEMWDFFSRYALDLETGQVIDLTMDNLIMALDLPRGQASPVPLPPSSLLLGSGLMGLGLLGWRRNRG
jgi:polyhydroxybutyrate depolymerase